MFRRVSTTVILCLFVFQVGVAQQSHITEKQLLQEVEDMMQRLTKADVFSGTLLIAKGDKVLMSFAGGEASKRFHVPNNMDTKFNLG